MGFEVKDSHEFRRLMATLARDIGNAHFHWKMFRNLEGALDAQAVVYEQSPTFWSLTLDAHREAAVLHLCRAFDSHHDALSLTKWLGVIRDHLYLFDVEEFDKRMAEHPFAHTLRNHAVRPDLEALGDDETRCSSKDPLVKRLIRFRGNVTAHMNAAAVRDSTLAAAAGPIEYAEVEELLNRASAVLSTYSLLFSADVFATSMFGADDYRNIFSTVAGAVDAAVARDRSLLDAASASK